MGRLPNQEVCPEPRIWSEAADRRFIYQSACRHAPARRPLNDWYLVLPPDPTLEHYLDWFGTVSAEAVDKLKKDQMLDPPPSAKEEDLLGVVIAS